VARVPYIELDRGRNAIRIPIIHEDRSVLALDKPAGWLLIPFSWQSTQRNLQTAITSSIAAGDFWARSRNLRFLRAVHRLDGDTSGVLLLARSPGALDAYSALFESRRMEKRYLAVVHGVPATKEWTCHARLSPDPDRHGLVRIDPRHGKDTETRFRLLAAAGSRSLVEARPVTGRTHQIRVHLREAGHAVVGDSLYGPPATPKSRSSRKPGHDQFPLGLRAVELAYIDPFRRCRVEIRADEAGFLKAFHFAGHQPPP
jgi:RluA family pseudouridine synthase